MDSTRIIQLSDCHVSATADAVYRGINPRSELEKLLAVMSDWQPDLLLLTGDLAEDGSREAYEYLEDRLAGLDVPVHTLPGNHDNHQLQSAVFASTAVDEALQISAGAWMLLLLNSSRPKMIAGKLDPAQLDSVEAALAAHPGPAMVFLHHQPVPVGSSWIDRYALQSAGRFWSVLDRHEQVKVVAWGHVHQGFEAGRGCVKLLSAPSSAINSLPGKEKFTPDQAGPACRWFVAHADGELESGVLRA
ncbi:MAG: phosphodiesterase [Xanthomonadales bacterium]|nr:phosphodiesterase [Xanthomonadales bacterium]NNL95094.1 phosphodiesterase [Xanthomonadales bacterium]